MDAQTDRQTDGRIKRKKQIHSRVSKERRVVAKRESVGPWLWERGGSMKYSWAPMFIKSWLKDLSITPSVWFIHSPECMKYLSYIISPIACNICFTIWNIYHYIYLYFCLAYSIFLVYYALVTGTSVDLTIVDLVKVSLISTSSFYLLLSLSLALTQYLSHLPNLVCELPRMHQENAGPWLTGGFLNWNITRGEQQTGPLKYLKRVLSALIGVQTYSGVVKTKHSTLELVIKPQALIGYSHSMIARCFIIQQMMSGLVSFLSETR